MKMCLKGKGVWTIVTGDEVLAEDADDATKKTFAKRADLALASIGLNVTKGLQIYVRNEETAKGHTIREEVPVEDNLIPTEAIRSTKYER